MEKSGLISHQASSPSKIDTHLIVLANPNPKQGDLVLDPSLNWPDHNQNDVEFCEVDIDCILLKNLLDGQTKTKHDQTQDIQIGFNPSI